MLTHRRKIKFNRIKKKRKLQRLGCQGAEQRSWNQLWNSPLYNLQRIRIACVAAAWPAALLRLRSHPGSLSREGYDPAAPLARGRKIACGAAALLSAGRAPCRAARLGCPTAPQSKSTLFYLRLKTNKVKK